MKRAWGSTTDRILLLLADDPLTKAEICEELGLTHDQVASVLSRLRKKSKLFPRRIYISGYKRTMEGQKEHIRAIYAAGNKPNRKRPAAATQQERAAKSYRIRITRLRNRSIFSHAESTRQLLART